MKAKIYDESHVKLNNLLGRKYNNPLGDNFLRLIACLIGARIKTDVLDLGCGRGASLLWLAKHTSAKLTGIDPSNAMVTDANKNISSANLSKRINVIQGTIDQLPAKRVFDLIFSLDVLSWVSDKGKFLSAVQTRLKPNGIFVLSGYFVLKPKSQYVKKLCNEWQIPRPGMFESYKRLFETAGFEPFFTADTTKQYYEHWKDIKIRLRRAQKKAISVVGTVTVINFERKVDSILKAIEDHAFGHLVVLAKKQTV